jgi:hypothetical protein
LVFLSDEDDCSAAMNDGMFGDKPELRAESASLRCATRGHMCGGQKLADINPPGYPTDPTNGSYSHAFNDCLARTDTCPNKTDGYDSDTDTSVPTSCSPLKNVKHLADEIKGLKADPDNQILVAGIFGWPLNDTDMAAAQYKIAPIPNPNTADTNHPTVYDYWPICYDPGNMPKASTTDSATGFDATAAGIGATGGLREAAFVDEFGKTNGLKFSICQTDFSASMKVIGDAIAKKLQNLCVNYKLIDTDLGTAGVQADCRVVFRNPKPDKADPTKITYEESPTSMPQCPPNAVQGSVTEDCWQLTSDKVKCEVNGQLIQVLRTKDEIAKDPTIPAGTKVGMQCRTCTDPIKGFPVATGCDYNL